LGKLEEKDENFGLRIDFIVEMSCRKEEEEEKGFMLKKKGFEIATISTLFLGLK
jgi:hypothetical protein